MSVADIAQWMNFGLTALVAIGGYIGYQNKIKRDVVVVLTSVKSLSELIQKHETDDRARFERIEEELIVIQRQIVSDGAARSREAGESIAAIRQKVHEVETWSRDNFLRRESFTQTMAAYEARSTESRNDLKDRLGRIESKIDHMTNEGN